MKKLKGVLGVLIAVSTMMLFSSCCSLHCHNLVQNGSFEETSVAPNTPYTDFPSGTSHWTNSSGSQNYLVVNSDGAIDAPNIPANRFFNTPCGKKSVNIGGRSAYQVASISQTISNNLIANKTYCLSFLQSSDSYSPSNGAHSEVTGVIRVQLLSSAGQNILKTNLFVVSTNTAWKKKWETVKIPDGGTGPYTLTFSCIGTNGIYEQGGDTDGETVANLDAVRLCKKPWWIFW